MDKKELIRQSAIKVIAREGYHEARIKDIADEAGIAAGTVYLYFKNKEEILDYIFCIEHQRRAAFVKELYEKELPIEVILDKFIDFNIDCFSNEPETAKVLYEEVFTLAFLTEQKAQYYIDEVIKVYINIVKREQEKGRIRSDLDAECITPSIINFLRFASYTLLSTGDHIMTNSWQHCQHCQHMKKQLKALILNGITSCN